MLQEELRRERERESLEVMDLGDGRIVRWFSTKTSPLYIERTKGEWIRLSLKNLISGAHWAPSSNQKSSNFSFYREYGQEGIWI